MSEPIKVKPANNELTVSGGREKPMDNDTTQARPPEYGGATGSTFQHLRLHNPIVAHIMRAGGTAEDCAVALAVNNDRLVDRLMTLEGIAPRKIKLPDGRVMVWRCSDHLIPETEMSNNALSTDPAPAAAPAQPKTCGDCGWLTNARETVGDCGAPIPDVIDDPGAILATVAKTRDARFCECRKPKEPTR